MYELIAQFQTTAFEMNLAGLITDREFSILEALTDEMINDTDALEVVATITMKDLQDEDVTDSILAKKFSTALTIYNEE